MPSVPSFHNEPLSTPDTELLEEDTVVESETPIPRPAEISSPTPILPRQEPVAGRTHPMTTRLQHGIRKQNPCYALLTKVDIPSLPTSVATALKHPGWTSAMGEETEAQHHNGTMTLVPRQHEMHVLGCRWIFTVKLNEDGTFKCFKARLVSRGYEQEEGIDFIETYSPVVRTSTIRIVLSVAVVKGWSIRQLDVKHAFLHGELQEEVYIEQPPGFVNGLFPDHVCKLNKSLYGLKQAPRAWFNKFTNFLIEYGFRCSNADPSMFTFHCDGHTLVLLLHVDDVLLTGNSPELLEEFFRHLSQAFSMKDMGLLHYFLGIHVQQHPKGFSLNQTKYTEEILYEAGMSNANPMPMPQPTRLDAAYHDKVFFPEPSYFRSLAGKLQYLTLTRPDIQFSFNFVCQRLHSPTMTDFQYLKRILHYVCGTSQYGLHLYKESSLDLNAYSDSDWAGCQETRRSTTDFCAFLGSNMVSWCAKRQLTVS